MATVEVQKAEAVTLQSELQARPVRSREGLAARTHVLVLLGFTFLTVLMTYPVAFRLSAEVPGGGDAWQHIWNLWWVKRAVLTEHTNPYFTSLVYFPEGASLYFHTLVLSAGIIGIPLQLLGLNLIATYNVILLSSFVLAGYGAFLLCHYLTRSTWGSFVGGIVFTFSPYHMAHMFGHMNLVSLQWMPFYVLVALQAADAPVDHNQPRTRLRGILLAVGAGALLALNAYTDWLYAIFLVVFSGLLALWKMLLPSERARLAQRGVSWVEAALRGLVAVCTFILLTLPVLLPTLEEAGKGYAQQAPYETLVYSSDAMLAVTPSELHPIWGPSVRESVNKTGPYLPLKNSSERVVFLGYSVLLLGMFAVWRRRRDAGVVFWAFAAAATWVLSLGPILQLQGQSQFTAFGVTVPLPYLLLYKLPLFSIMRTPARLAVLTMLALAVLVAFALAPLLAEHRPWRASATANLRRLIAFVVLSVILFEFLALPFPTVPPGWNVPIYSRIAAEQGNFALLELPLRPFGDYMAYQTVHGKPIVGGYLSRQPVYETVENTPALWYLRDSTPVDDPAQHMINFGRGVQSLRDLGVRYVIIRWWAFTPEHKAAMQTKLELLLGRPPDETYPADQVDVWRIGGQ